ncbi:trypsin-like peptidase domain-containing protein [Aeromonas sp. 2692-1]|uniref:S1 family peptidase n=1 Tax=Aeromonas sp. 2692-1 TaxID=2560029 RepID=UPI00148B18F8|nr:serine protease [Aeromonas sp. 2692-1]QJT11640.1 trypsin-like peptidase domain-containing protein [Aeromonas sp. 2692-1]
MNKTNIVYLEGEQIRQKKISPISLFPLHLELHKAGIKIGEGTGFIYLHQDSNKKFLVTNYHVVTCRDPKDPASLLPGYPDSPDEIKFSTLMQPKLRPEIGAIKINADTTWYEHSRRAEGVDIVAIEISFPDEAVTFTQDMLGLVEDIDVMAGSDLFIVGFPWGYSVEDYYPIWKRGTVASEPSVKPNGLSMFFIDAFTHPGMSGSPVFVSSWRSMVDLNREAYDSYHMYKEGNLSATDFISSIDTTSMEGKSRLCFSLVGIYSGRVSVRDKDPNIGIVWQRSLIDELFNVSNLVKHPYPPIEVSN